jgi:peptidoglycan-associated lipoprotein
MKSRNFAVFVVMVLVAAVAGCQQRVATKQDAQDGQQGTVHKHDKEAERVTEKSADSRIQSADTGSQYVESKDSTFSDVNFDFDKYDVKDQYKPLLQSVASWMGKNGSSKLSIEGHCDERGTNEYNLALGDRRAKAVRDYLISLGVASGKLDIISYGEEKPLCTDQNEDCWGRNRRAHFVILNKAGK